MPFVQPYTYVNGNTVSSVNITNNEEALKLFVNQEIVVGDLGLLTLHTSDIARGIYYAIDKSYTFETSDISHISTLQIIANREYQTSTAKNNIQTTGIQYQDIANSGVRVHAKQSCSAIINVHLNYHVNNNEAPSPPGQGNGMWWNKLVLVYRNLATDARTVLDTQTDNYTFEGTGTSSDTLNPGADLNQANTRSQMLTYRVLLSAGYYGFTMSVDPHNEEGWAEVKNMTVELFYI